MFQAFIALLHRDLTLVMRRRQDALYGMAFFVIVVSLFPLGMGPEPALLQRIAPGAIWAAALLASLLTLERLFADDCGEHTLESLLLAPQPLSLLVLAKLVAHWLYAGLPLVVIAPCWACNSDWRRPSSSPWSSVCSWAPRCSPCWAASPPP